MSWNVPTSKFQMRQHEQALQASIPDTGSIQKQPCMIIELYDQERLDEGGVPDEVTRLRAKPQNAGKIYAQVRMMHSGDTHFLAIKDGAGTLFTTGGNSVTLQGTPGRVEFTRLKVSEGEVIPVDDPGAQMANNALAVEINDIGLLV